MPKGPVSNTASDRITPSPKLGRNSVYIHTADPMPIPAIAPSRVAPRQKMPPISAGRICATPVKLTRPIADSAAPPPDSA